MYYAGVGSRETPEEIGVIMTKLARELEASGYVLRSGGATGADTFFENGVKWPCHRRIYLHKDYVRGRRSDPEYHVHNAARFRDWDRAMQIASEIHPAWHRCGDDARGLHARNVYQVLGYDFEGEHPWYSSFLVCWAIPDIHGVPEGGTRTAWKVAEMYNIPRYNLAVRADRDRIETWLNSQVALHGR